MVQTIVSNLSYLAESDVGYILFECLDCAKAPLVKRSLIRCFIVLLIFFISSAFAELVEALLKLMVKMTEL